MSYDSGTCDHCGAQIDEMNGDAVVRRLGGSLALRLFCGPEHAAAWASNNRMPLP